MWFKKKPEATPEALRTEFVTEHVRRHCENAIKHHGSPKEALPSVLWFGMSMSTEMTFVFQALAYFMTEHMEWKNDRQD